MSIRRLLVIQPENKTLIATNTGGDPVDLLTIADVVRCNDSLPSENGDYFFKFISSTSLVVFAPSSVSAEISVTTDGLTYNTNIGNSGIDIIFEDGRNSGDELHVEVIAAVTGRDTSLRRLAERRNFGSCDDLRAVNTNPRDRVILIHFGIPSKVKNVLKVHGVIVMGYKQTISGTTRKLEMYAILPANGDWIEGTKCDTNAGAGQPSWLRKSDNNPNVNWAGTSGCQEIGVDVESDILSLPTLGNVNEWLEFTSNGDSLTDYGDRILKSPGHNHGFMIRTEEFGPAGTTCIFHSSEYTTDKSLRPKMLFLYEEEKLLDAGVSPNYAASMGTEETFGGS